MKIRLTSGRLADFKHEGTGRQSFLWDTDAVGLAVRATPPSVRHPLGTKAFVFQSRFQGETVRITIGDARAWTLDDARNKARTFQNQIDEGRDPREVKAAVTAADKAAKTARVVAKAEEEHRKRYTLKAMCEAYCAGLKAKGKSKSARDSLSAFRVHVFETEHAEKPARHVSSMDIAEIIRTVLESGKTRTAGILRNYLVAAYNAARRAPFNPQESSGLIRFDITTNPAEVVTAIPVSEGERCLKPEELKLYIEALGNTPVDLLLKAHLYAGGQRMAQLARAKVSDYNVETQTIRLLDPKGRRKTPRVHFLPMAQKGAAIVSAFAEAKKDTPDAKLFGASERAAGDRVSEISAELKVPSFDLRDLRRTCETMLVAMGITKETRAQLLSHGLGGVQDKHYDRHSYTAEKHGALQAWESRLDEILTGKKPTKEAKVVGMTRRSTA